MRYTKEQLYAMPIHQLRGIDIQDKEEEVLVQEVVNARLAEMPVENPVNFTSMQTDGLTPEKEAELQKEIDQKQSAMKAQLEPTEPGPLPDPTAVPVEPLAPEPAPAIEEKPEEIVPEPKEVEADVAPSTKKVVATTTGK